MLYVLPSRLELPGDACTDNNRRDARASAFRAVAGTFQISILLEAFRIDLESHISDGKDGFTTDNSLAIIDYKPNSIVNGYVV